MLTGVEFIYSIESDYLSITNGIQIPGYFAVSWVKGRLVSSVSAYSLFEWQNWQKQYILQCQCVKGRLFFSVSEYSLLELTGTACSCGRSIQPKKLMLFFLQNILHNIFLLAGISPSLGGGGCSAKLNLKQLFLSEWNAWRHKYQNWNCELLCMQWALWLCR